MKRKPPTLVRAGADDLAPAAPPAGVATWNGARGLAVSSAVTIMLVGIAVGGYGWTRGEGDEMVGGVAILALGCALTAWSTSSESPALATLASVGGLVQVGAILIYYYYDFALDAARYHGDAVAILGGRPPFGSSSSEWGTDMVGFLLAIVYRVTTPSMLLGFVLAASIGFLGRIVLARALLRSAPTLGPIALVAAWTLMLLPSLNMWLAAISKESFAILGIGLVLAALLRPSHSPSYPLIAAGLASISVTRPHLAVLLAFSLVVFAVSFTRAGHQPLGRRLALLLVVAALGALSLNVAANFLGVDASIGGLETAREDVSSISDEGDSNIEQQPIRSPRDFPRGLATVLLRPHPFEAENGLQLAQAFESTLLVLVGLWLLMQRRRRARRPLTGAAANQVRALRAFALSYVAGFVYAYSGVYNLGLMSRQRVQVVIPLIVLAATALVRTSRRAAGPTAGRSRGGSPVLVVRPLPSPLERDPS